MLDSFTEFHEFLNSNTLSDIRIINEYFNLTKDIIKIFVPYLLKKNLSVKDIEELDFLIRYEHSEKIRGFLNAVYELDVYYGLSLLLRDPSFSVAEPSDENEICIEDLFHPLIPNAVKNSIKFTCQKNICLLTGANMSGKSTFMKSIGLSIYLAQLGFPVPAKYMRFKLMDGIITSINLTDDLNLGYSHFYSEIKRIKTVAENLNKKQRLLVVFDELFRGTNLQDASEGSIEIINALSTIDKESFFVFSSHIYEIVNSLEKNNNIFFKYFKTQKKWRSVY